MDQTPISRRTLITGAAVAAGGAILSNLTPAEAQQTAAAQASAAPARTQPTGESR